MHKTPYENLNPDVILSAIESIGYLCSGSLFALNSYENRVYQIGIEDHAPLIAKFYRPGRWSDEAILEEHQFALELAGHEIPIVAPIVNADGETLHKYEGFRFSVFPRQAGRTLELDNADQLEWIGRFIGRLHAVGASKPFKHRIRLDVARYGYEPYEFLRTHHFIPDSLKHNYEDIAMTALKKIEDCFQHFGEINYLRIHGDCHAGNVLWSASGPQIVDLDDCLMGPAIQDIWMLLPGATVADSKFQLDCILSGYEEFYDFNRREIHLVEVLRTLRMLHYSAWLAKRWDDPAFPLSFPWFNTPRYWEEQLHHMRGQADLLDLLLE